LPVRSNEGVAGGQVVLDLVRLEEPRFEADLLGRESGQKLADRRKVFGGLEGAGHHQRTIAFASRERLDELLESLVRLTQADEPVDERRRRQAQSSTRLRSRHVVRVVVYPVPVRDLYDALSRNAPFLRHGV